MSAISLVTRIFYWIGLQVYHLGIRFAAVFNDKAKAWVRGRKNWHSKLIQWRSAQPLDKSLVWVHCASLGEFEQGRSVIEAIRLRYPNHLLVLTFYSPSGYILRKNYKHADYVCYLPPDSPQNARKWLNSLQPDLAIFVKYEFWAFHLRALFARQIPTVLIAASFRRKQLFFRWYGSWFKALLPSFSHIFVQTQNDQLLLETHGIATVSVAGDPRLDRVLQIAQQTHKIPSVAKFKGNAQLFIAGSTWPIGEEMLLKDITKWEGKWKLLIAPHDVSENHILALTNQLELPYVRYSQLNAQSDLTQKRIFILDTIGMLSQVYSYGNLAYIGGGFGISIHNTLEPTAYNLPVLFGPKHQKFPEALHFAASGGGIALQKPEDFDAAFSTLTQSDNYTIAQKSLTKYFEASAGATERILQSLSSYL